ncbi:undecaprenyldiphospho-muramoylpentapeptide beta-N-acetylglucosaminyltransferase [Salirhabdus sp. Marseille-P4669]|uniref:undecaprenyldiphospho-muramoylpentapeptide beta-N-acetylglucosaminyltransferase n=1 Tax=Salirhabdus sp. Marseille-P4669 TaxID=2042310 RepID=UPI000C7B0B59|nr:undecaprenyldiphospho-muramoylpentapeptide beta-N-acetylglucosaminyltransferase [Salirhabdus sp. Marseille-P4669]
MKKETIVFTGGGTAGHVVVNLALIPEFLKDGWDVHYIGSHKGIERDLIEPLAGVTYHCISVGKLRRYFDKENFKDPFRVVKGTFQAMRILGKLKPKVIFSKGGFVSVPVVTAAKLRGIPAFIHESDYTPGLANKLSFPFAKRVLATFPETMKFLPEKKAMWVGAIIREELFQGNKTAGLNKCNFTSSKPVIMVMGGSSGSKKLNDIVRDTLEHTLKDFQIIHITGKGNVDESIEKFGYVQFEYVQDELKDLLAATDMVVSRAGSNSIYEFLALQKPMLLIPLSKQASRGDQILNANSFQKQGFAHVLEEENLSKASFMKELSEIWANHMDIKTKMRTYKSEETKDEVVKMLKNPKKK